MHKGAGRTAHGSATQYRHLYAPEKLTATGDRISNTVRMLTGNKRENGNAGQADGTTQTGLTADQHRPADAET